MPRPRPILKSRSYHVGRRCSQRQFLLRPEPEITEGFKFMLGEAARRYGILIYALVVMSNHYHLVAHDPRGNICEFEQYLNSMTGHAFNVRRARRENFWAPRRSKPTYLVELEDIIRMVVYTLVNPVEAGLVERANLWPGLTSYAWLDGRTVTAERPRFYFDPDGDVPKTVSFTLSVPPEFDGDAEAWKELIHRRVAEEEATIQKRRRAEGLRFLGRKAVLKASVHRRGTVAEELGERMPLVAAQAEGVFKRAMKELKHFYLRYQAALARFRSGLRDTIFPEGTWMLARRYGVNVAPS